MHTAVWGSGRLRKKRERRDRDEGPEEYVRVRQAG